ncbi:ABC transporter permease [Thiorhodovibrio frisius]|uniref:Transport permease protein n=1 Tax=Thiorhodovibrio frisius TaxID=631362 RepID=H8Z1U7_9GAMM|nr:ABC transporter permease [Thiorhodovibrio frisius]EIC22575.1 ABC-type polysaccharide/polyol phosphate export system, permease component [Thiorhodovibrio frisius]WPL20016.1 Polysialic acid transport protein KpsM [Thiorhodovibrio frisius]
MRSPWQVTWSVWHALFMREVLARTTQDRMGGLWMLGEPIMMVAFMVSLRTFIGRTREIIGAEFIPWLIIGLTGFFMVRNAIQRGMSAIQANQALFAYRQIKPVDPLLVRHAMEGMLQTIVLLILAGVAVLAGINDALPDDVLGVFFLWLSLWLLGLGCALVVSVVVRLVPDLERLVKLSMLPLLILSGVIFPLQRFPPAILDYLLYNPIAHGLELLRARYFDGYHMLAGVSLEYLWRWIIISLALGLALHARFERRLKAK